MHTTPLFNTSQSLLSQLQVLSDTASSRTAFPESISYISDTADLIAKIIFLLGAGVDFRHRYHNLQNELDVTRQILILVGQGIQVFKDLPIGRSLDNTINPEVKKCRTIVQKILDNIEYYHTSLHSTSLDCVWSLIWWNGWGEKRLPWLRMKLYSSRHTLAVFLMALNSIEWENLGNKMRVGDIPLKDFRMSLLRGPSSLQHIPFDSIRVIDHLGSTIPVPRVLCFGWDDFNYIINGYCANRIGNRYIRRGDYRLIRGEDNYVITPWAFAAAANTNKTLEISIVLRQRVAFQESKEKCPRCNHINHNITTTSGWIECRRCSGRFQVAQAEETDKDYGHESDGDDSSVDENIWPVSSPNQQRADNESMQFQSGSAQYFRRISLICIDKEKPLPPIDLSGIFLQNGHTGDVRSFKESTSVFWWDANGEKMYGKVQETSRMDDGTQIASINSDKDGLVFLPVIAISKCNT